MTWTLLLRFILAALATWRVSFLLAREDGPGRMVSRVRESLTARLGPRPWTCVKCLSMWVAIPFALFVGGTWGEQVVTWLALSGVAAWIDESTRPPFEWRETESQESAGDELLRTKAESPR